jgi:regulatory protein
MQKLDTHTARAKIQKFCTYQERCHKEVQSKLIGYGLEKSDMELILMELIEMNFVNEERFSRAYAGGKFRSKKWGRNRIIQELKHREISDYGITAGLLEIPDVNYHQTLKELIEKKLTVEKGDDRYVRNGRVATYCIRKGYESDLVWDKIREISPNL